MWGSTQALAGALFIVGLLAVWELWRLVQVGSRGSLWVMWAVFAACAVQLWVWNRQPGFEFVLFWILLGSGLVHTLASAWVLSRKPNLMNLLTGLYGAVYVSVVLYAVIQLHALGLWVLMSALLMVWATDVGGYFFGKGLGGKFVKVGLAPQISPKKSWEGAMGGVLLAMCVALGFYFSPLKAWVGQTSLVVCVLTFVLAFYSITGDLVESLLKRQAGVKDSSQLLPGHGGILDRIDALIPVLPLCAAWQVSTFLFIP